LSHSLMYSALTALGYPLGSLVSVYLIERIEPRTLLIVSTLAVAVFGVAFGLATNITLVIAAGVMTTISTVVSPTSPKPTSGVVLHRQPRHRHRLAVCSLPPGRRRVAVGRPDPARGRRAGALYTCCALLLAGMALAIGYSDRPPTTNSSTQTQSETRSESLGLNHSMRPRASKPLD
jgi:MFS family permease